MAKSAPSPDYLSSHLQWYVEEATGEATVDAETKIVVSSLISTATRSLEGFAPKAAADVIHFWKSHPDYWHWAVDDFYSRQAVANIPGLVDRFLKLAPILVGQIPSTVVSVYLQEATRCYLHGLFQASVALSRAAVEAGVNEILLAKLGTVPNADLVDKLKSLEKFKLLDAAIINEAHGVRKAGGTVLHHSPAKEAESFEILLKTRRVLMKLYSTTR